MDSRCEEPVALKFPRHRPDSSSEEMDLVKAEAQMAMRLKHPGIVATRAIENIDSFAFIVQDFVDGMNLKTFMERTDPGQRDVGMLVAQVADALARQKKICVSGFCFIKNAGKGRLPEHRRIGFRATSRWPMRQRRRWWKSSRPQPVYPAGTKV